MVGLIRSLRTRYRRRRFRSGFAPRTAPHWTTVRELIEARVAPLDRRARPRVLDALADRVVFLERSPTLFSGDRELVRLRALETRVRQALAWAIADRRHLRRRFAQFTEHHDRAAGRSGRLAVLRDWLADTAPDRRTYRGDVRALDRLLDLDALRERHERELHRIDVMLELGVAVLGHVGRERWTSGDLIESRDDLDAFLAERLERERRWQTRRAAAHALAGYVRASNEAGGLGPERVAAVATLARAVASERHDDPWIPAAAVRVAFACGDASGFATADAVLGRDPGDGLGAREFLARAAVLREIAAAAPEDRAIERLARAIDPEREREHVRATVADCAPDGGSGLALVARLATEDPSPKVRGRAIRSAGRRLAGDADGPVAEAAADLLAAVLENDRDDLALSVACDAIRASVEARAFPGVARAPWREALATLRGRPDVSRVVRERARAVATVLADASDGVRAELRARLAEIAASIRPGDHRDVPLEGWPERVRALVHDPDVLGTVLASIARTGFGLSADVRDDTLVLWRGDRVRRSLWRVLHELRSPAPDKRPGVAHTIGRAPRGPIRAPSSLLDEATATTVPGERVRIEGEAGWGPHVPLVEDVLHLPLRSADEVRIYSSHGVTRLRPPASAGARLKNRFRIAWRFAELARLRNESLATDGSGRRAFVERLRGEFGIEVEFSPLCGPEDDGRGESPDEAVRALFEVAP